MKLRLLAFCLILVVGLSTAQDIRDRQVETKPVDGSVQALDLNVGVDPGLVKADSPVYGVDVAFDNALQVAGLKSAGEVAEERASEVAVARERNNTRAAIDAVDRFNSAVSQADNRDRERLQKAESILGNVSEGLPEQADYGVSNALENVERAKSRVPDEMTVSGRNGSGGMLPDIKLPDVGGGQDIKPPGSDNRQGKNPGR